MGILTERVQALPVIRKRTCNFGKWVETLDAEDRKTVFALLDNHDWTITELTVFMRREAGATTSEKSVSRHRKHECLECTYESFG
jgi:hypothetical protein